MTLIPLPEVAGALGVTPQTIRAWIKSGKPEVKAIRVGRCWKIPQDELTRLLNEGTDPPAA